MCQKTGSWPCGPYMCQKTGSWHSDSYIICARKLGHGIVTHICARKLSHHWHRCGLVTYVVSSFTYISADQDPIECSSVKLLWKFWCFNWQSPLNSLCSSDIRLHQHWFRWWMGTFSARLNIKMVFPGMVISIIKIRRLWDPLIFTIGISIPLYIETAPR